MDEAAVVVAAAAAPLIEIIRYGIDVDEDELTSVEVVHKINECIYLRKQMHLIMNFPGRDDFDVDDDENYQLFRFDATGAMQNTIVENSRHIKKITMSNACDEEEEHIRCYTFFCTKIVLGLIGKGKHLTYNDDYVYEFELEQANQLAQALLRSNDNNDDAIESFEFKDPNLTTGALQPILDALLATGVRKITLGNNYDSFIDNNNINIDFTGMERNESLKELNLIDFYMQEENYRNLFTSMKMNKGLEKIELNHITYWNRNFSTQMKRLFEEMMCKNVTLLDFGLDGNEQGEIFQMIRFHMEQNRMMKRYIIKREREKKAPTVITRRDNNNNDEEEKRKKRLKMRLLFRVFHEKPVMRDTILFHLLSEYLPFYLVREYPGDFIDTNNERDSESNDDTNDPDDSFGDGTL